tara:strand:+ start:4623 stop:5450 length:828 start_codon:yes stop_codon:yes gene_type:complete
MALSIDQAFITQFESEVHLAYQRAGAKLKNTTRQVNNVTGSTARFQKIGKGEAVTKSRHAEVTSMDLTHTNVDVTLSDYYAADYIDTLDLLKTNIDERQVVATNAANALGRKTDDLIISALDAGNGTTIAAGSAGLTKAKVLNAFVSMNESDIPDDGQRYFVVSPEGWADLLAIDEFVNTDYVKEAEQPFPSGFTQKKWLGFNFMIHSALPISTNDRKCFAYHKSAIGTATGSDVRTEVNYIPEKVSNLVTSYMSMGSIAVDTTGIIEVVIDESV